MNKRRLPAALALLSGSKPHSPVLKLEPQGLGALQAVATAKHRVSLRGLVVNKSQKPPAAWGRGFAPARRVLTMGHTVRIPCNCDDAVAA